MVKRPGKMLGSRGFIPERNNNSSGERTKIRGYMTRSARVSIKIAKYRYALTIRIVFVI